MIKIRHPVVQDTQKILRYFLGHVMPFQKPDPVRVEIRTLELDNRLQMYFMERKYVHCQDDTNKCKTDDIVLIQELGTRKTRLISHRIIDIIHPFGDYTCPITGKKIFKDNYRDQLEKIDKIYGRRQGAYDYYKQPPRGRLEGTSDLTDKPTFTKLYDDPNDDQPYGF